MKLLRLTVANFRGFDQIDIDFDPHLTVIAGVNGVGKSGVLRALASALSHALPRITPSSQKPIGFTDSDVQLGKSGLSLSATIRLNAANLHVDIARATVAENEKAKDLLRRRDELRFATRETKKRSNEEQAINDDIRLIDLQLASIGDVPTVRVIPDDSDMTAEVFEEQSLRGTSQPIAVFYSTARFFSRLSPIPSKTKTVSIATAFEKALEQPEVSLSDLANWFRVIGARPEAERISQQLNAAVRSFLPEVSNLFLHEKPARFSVEKNGGRLFLEQLSDGERGLLAVVFDLTRRLAAANPGSEDPIAEGVAVVLIDEIELHLHPKWQRHVLRKLSQTFKQSQFVVTSHSPQVIGQIRPEALRLLHTSDDGKVRVTHVTQSFGMDSNWILQHVMGVPARDYGTEQRLSSIYAAIDGNNLRRARTLAEELRSEIGDFPDLQEALALIDRLEMLGHQ